jgi:hypothetical protein
LLLSFAETQPLRQVIDGTYLLTPLTHFNIYITLDKKEKHFPTVLSVLSQYQSEYLKAIPIKEAIQGTTLLQVCDKGK